MGVSLVGPEPDDGRTRVAHAADNAAMSSGCHIAARPGIRFLDIAGGKDLLLLNDDRADIIAYLKTKM